MVSTVSGLGPLASSLICSIGQTAKRCREMGIALPRAQSPPSTASHPAGAVADAAQVAAGTATVHSHSDADVSPSWQRTVSASVSMFSTDGRISRVNPTDVDAVAAELRSSITPVAGTGPGGRDA